MSLGKTLLVAVQPGLQVLMRGGVPAPPLSAIAVGGNGGIGYSVIPWAGRGGGLGRVPCSRIGQAELQAASAVLDVTDLIAGQPPVWCGVWPEILHLRHKRSSWIK